MSVNSYTSDLSSSLVLSYDEKSKISTSIDTLSARLDSYFGDGVIEHFKFGSSTRGTILPRKADGNSDIDYMIVFNVTEGEKKPQTYLNRLKKFAEVKYSTSEIYQSSPTIVLSLNHIKFELVPAVSQQFGGYKIPSPSSSWIEWMSTDPNSFNQKVTLANTNNNSQIKPLVRLIKYWNAINGHHFTSFSLEDFVCDQYYRNCSTQKDYFYLLWENFRYSNDTAQYIKDKVNSAKNTVNKAKENESQGYIAIAESLIAKMLPKL